MLREMPRKFRQWPYLTVHEPRTVENWKRAALQIASSRTVLIIIFLLVIGVGLALVGPYGTFFTLKLSDRLLYWVPSMFVSMFLWVACQMSVRWLAKKMEDYWVSPAVIIDIAASLPFAAFGALQTLVLAIIFDTWRRPDPIESWLIFFQSWLIMSAVVVVPGMHIARRLMRQQKRQWGQAVFGFLEEKLPHHLRGSDLWALKSEDHYVRIFTSAGDDLVLMRLSDAITALEGYPGDQVHRSWWVAKAAITDYVSANGKIELILCSGLKVPVSRRRKDVLPDLMEVKTER